MIRKFSAFAVLIFGLTCLNFANAQSRLTGDKFTFSAANFPDSFGTTYDPTFVPRGEEFFEFESLDNDGDDWGGAPVEMTFDGIAEQAGGIIVNERAVQWAGKEGGIFAKQAAGIDGVPGALVDPGVLLRNSRAVI